MHSLIKYVIVAVLLVAGSILISSDIFSSQTKETAIDKNCYTITDSTTYLVGELTLKDTPTEKDPNNKTTVIIYKNITQYVTYTKCKPFLETSMGVVDYSMQGYNCKNASGEVICDSCTDGNCDGICAANGGESCCKLIDNYFMCKNSRTDWNTETKLSISKLTVRPSEKPILSSTKVLEGKEIAIA